MIADQIIQKSLAAGHLSELAGHYFSFFQRMDPKANELVWLCGALLIHQCQAGHSCLKLSGVAGKLFVELLLGEDQTWESDEDYRFPDPEDLLLILQDSLLVGSPGEQCPLIIDNSKRLYFYRFLQYENRLAAMLRNLASNPECDLSKVKDHLDLLFPRLGNKTTDWQKVAAATAVLQRLCIISGGPGTGKTYTVVKIIALLLMQAAPVKRTIVLAAPTGKAAGRLQQSINAVAESLNLPTEILSNIPSEAKTIHRLLRPVQHTPQFRYNKTNKLPCDILIVDEVSMIDLALMVKLCEAMPENGHLILLGDKDQLSSVEAGSVMADICSCSPDNHFSADYCQKLESLGVGGELKKNDNVSSLQDCIVHLKKSYRFNDDSGIGKLAKAVLRGDASLAQICLKNQSDLQITSWPNNDDFRSGTFNNNSLSELICEQYGAFMECCGGKDPVQAFRAFNKFQVLCAHRRGLVGVSRINKWIESILKQKRYINSSNDWYHGRPVIVTGNHYSLGLFNGDIGITMLDHEDRLRVFFEQGQGDLFSISPSRMPEHETAFALTVHKSQGSEFDSLLLILPEKLSPIVSRELLYTAITRAKKNFTLAASNAVLKEGIKKQIKRSTGLAERLQNLNEISLSL